MSCVESNADQLTTALSLARDNLKQVLEEAKSKFEELGSNFVKEGIAVLYRGIDIYADLFKRTNVEDRKALELTITKDNSHVKEVALELLDVEDELFAAGCGVVVITFGAMSGAKHWLQETKCPFPYYRDPTRAFYHHLGLEISIKKVWNTATLNFYGSELAKSTHLPVPYSNIEDDPHQMGGDFILDKNYKLVYTYPCKTPNDRPSVDEVIKAVEDLIRSN